MAKKNKRVVRYRARLNLNVGLIIFGIIFLYLSINIIIFLTTDRVKYYEVVSGTSSEETNKSYTGLALRDEKIAYAKDSGYIDFYVRECARVSKNTTLYSIDADGSINKLLGAMSKKDSALTEDNARTIKELLYNYTNNFDSMEFNEVYNFKSSLQGTVVDLINMNALKTLISTKKLNSNFVVNKPASTGIVLYKVDNYETLKPQKLTFRDFYKDSYVAAGINSGDQIKKGNPIYKTVTDEEWRIAIQLTKDEIKKYKKTTGVRIKFLKDGITSTANFEIVKGADKKKYGIITLAKYMVRYSSERFINIQIIDDVTTGLKIPKTSIVTKDLYIIPKEYGIYGGDSDKIGFLRQVQKEGKTVPEYYYPIIAYSDDNNYYVSMSSFSAGELIIQPDSTNVYKIEKTQSLVGVYNINNGYTVFVQVTILGETGEYYIVESGETYGLAVYDHIVLDSSLVKENQVIFQ